MSGELARNVLALPAIEEATTVMAFTSFGSEVDTGPIIDGLEGGGRRVVLPRVEGPVIVPVSYRSGDLVMPSSFGALEPADGEPVVPEEIDVVIVPGLAFDRSGHRVGYGRGYYDRFMGLLRPDALSAGVCFSVQLVEEVPHGRGDRPVDLVVRTLHDVERVVIYPAAERRLDLVEPSLSEDDLVPPLDRPVDLVVTEQGVERRVRPVIR